MITDAKIPPQARVGWKAIRLALGTTATGQTGKIPDQVTPGFDFEIMAAEVCGLTVTATITVDLLIGPVGSGVTALAAPVAPVAATPTNLPLAGTTAARRGSKTEVLQASYTSNGSGATTNGFITVWIRKIPGNGEVYAI